VIRRADRDALRAELRTLLGEDRPTTDELAQRRGLSNDDVEIGRDDRNGLER
jgi:hypothetical protein